jgi:hypothetical protein
VRRNASLSCSVPTVKIGRKSRPLRGVWIYERVQSSERTITGYERTRRQDDFTDAFDAFEKCRRRYEIRRSDAFCQVRGGKVDPPDLPGVTLLPRIVNPLLGRRGVPRTVFRATG